MTGNSLSTISEKERWWAALSYVFSPILPAVLMFIFDMDEYPFIRKHIYQAMVLGVFFLLVMPIILPATLCVGGVFWLLLPFYALQAFNGQQISIPWVSTWVKQQGWA